MHHLYLARRAFVLAAVSALSISSFAADPYPSKPVSLVVPYPAGGASDFVARTIQPQMQRLLGQPIVVDNVGGAGGAIGIQKVLAAPADGYQMTLATPMELVLAPMAMSAVRFKPDDMVLVANLMSASMALAVRKDLPVNNVDDLIALAKKSGTQGLTYGSVGPGSLYHLVGEKFAQQVGANLVHVSYKGMAPLTTDLLGGQIDLVFMPFAGPVPNMVKEGKLKVIGLTTRTPHPKFPQLAPLAANKALPGFEFDLWIGIQVPKNTPADVVDRINKAAYDALQVPEVVAALEGTGNVISPRSSRADLAKVYAQETARYQAIAKSINLQPQ